MTFDWWKGRRMRLVVVRFIDWLFTERLLVVAAVYTASFPYRVWLYLVHWQSHTLATLATAW